MSWRSLLVAWSGLVLGAASASYGQDKVAETPYYPLKVGTKWEYRAGDRKIVARVAKHEKVGDETAALIEVSADGNVVDRQQVAVTKDGVYRLSLNGAAYSPPFRLLSLPPKAGDSWRFKSKLKADELEGGARVAEAEVTVPAGKYKAFAVTADFKVKDRDASTTWYFAPDVGPVKIVVKGGTDDLVIELEKFEAGK